MRNLETAARQVQTLPACATCDFSSQFIQVGIEAQIGFAVFTT